MVFFEGRQIVCYCLMVDLGCNKQGYVCGVRCRDSLIKLPMVLLSGLGACYQFIWYLVTYWELMYGRWIAPHVAMPGYRIGSSGEVMDTFPYHMKVWLIRTKYLQI